MGCGKSKEIQLNLGDNLLPTLVYVCPFNNTFLSSVEKKSNKELNYVNIGISNLKCVIAMGNKHSIQMDIAIYDHNFRYTFDSFKLNRLTDHTYGYYVRMTLFVVLRHIYMSRLTFPHIYAIILHGKKYPKSRILPKDVLYLILQTLKNFYMYECREKITHLLTLMYNSKNINFYRNVISLCISVEVF